MTASTVIGRDKYQQYIISNATPCPLHPGSGIPPCPLPFRRRRQHLAHLQNYRSRSVIYEVRASSSLMNSSVDFLFRRLFAVGAEAAIIQLDVIITSFLSVVFCSYCN